MKQYQIKPSLHLLVATLLLYGMFIAGLLVFFDRIWSTSLLLLLALLLVLYEIQLYIQYTREKAEYLSVDLAEQCVKHEVSGICRQYEAFSVYTNRWWLTLKYGRRCIQNNNLMLLVDCFQSKSEYLDFRYQLIQLKKEIHVT